MKALIWIGLAVGMFLACSDDEPMKRDGEPVPDNEHMGIDKPKFVFGFEGENKYSYCPSIVELSDSTIHLFFCGNPENRIMVDNVFHLKILSDGSKSVARSVLQPGTEGTWDDHHTCDPSVITGNFLMAGISYRYALFYLGNSYRAYYNEIGVAFSNDLDDPVWVKYPGQLIKKSWTALEDQLLPDGGKSWGVGQPSAVSLDGKGNVLLTYTLGDKEGTRIVWSELDMSNMDHLKISSPMTMVKNGLRNLDDSAEDYTCNADFAINKKEDKIVMIRPVQPHPISYPSYLSATLEIDCMNLSDFLQSKGTWKRICRVTPYDTGYPRNHNAALKRSLEGWITDWQLPGFYFTVSKAEPEVQPTDALHAEWTYHIWQSKVMVNKK